MVTTYICQLEECSEYTFRFDPRVCRTKWASIARHLSVMGPQQALRTVAQHYALRAKIIGPPHALAYT